jgi:acetoin utilization protein AcuB
MYVKDKMTINPFTVSPDDSVADTLELMRSKNIRRVPVMQNRQLVGIVTERKLIEVSPSPATSLSVFEINYLLSKTKIESIMTKNVITVAPDTLVEDAAVIMRENKISGLPVMVGSELVGIITESAIFDAFIEIMGYRDKGSRIAVKVVNNKPGVLKTIAGIISDFDVNISHIVFQGEEIILRIGTVNTKEIVDLIVQNGFEVTSVDYFN